VVDALPDQLVGQVRTAALALKALENVLVEPCLALVDARRPAALSSAFGAPAMPAPWQALQTCRNTSLPFSGTAAGLAVPAAAGVSLLIASAGLPETASWFGGCGRAATALL
jgi:hypothetical protein